MQSELTIATYIILILIGFIPTILSIILFFKVWGMTNDVRDMKFMMKEWLDLEHPFEEAAAGDTKEKIVR